MNLIDAQKYCKDLAFTHYENFNKILYFFSDEIKQDIFNIYAYCRISDDLADEGDESPEIKIKNIEIWEKELEELYINKKNVNHPVYIALSQTIKKYSIPITPFKDLLVAFKRDIVFKPYKTFFELLDYCKYSANPVGKLFLYVFGYPFEKHFYYSNFTCTGLQLANFWQDITVDLEKERVYIPETFLKKYNLTFDDIKEKNYTENYIQLMKFLINFTRQYFKTGLQICKFLDKKTSFNLKIINYGGLAILDEIVKNRYKNILTRFKVSKKNYLRYLI